MKKILCIEDDAVTAREIISALTGEGFQVDWVADGQAGLTRALAERFEAITLDRMLPGLDGLAIVTRIREAGVDTPVLMISALGEVDERVRGLRAGGDDYLTKPFASEEMIARLEVLLRRREVKDPRDTVLRVEDLELDLITHRAQRRGRDLGLLPTELKLLELLMRNMGQVLTRTLIFEAVWGYHFDPGTNLVDVHIGRLRRKVDGAGDPPLIQTVRGSGYALSASD